MEAAVTLREVPLGATTTCLQNANTLWHTGADLPLIGPQGRVQRQLVGVVLVSFRGELGPTIPATTGCPFVSLSGRSERPQ